MTNKLNASTFAINAVASAQTVLKLLNHFALRDILPRRVQWVTSGDSCAIIIETDNIPTDIAEIIAEKMRNQTNVQLVVLNFLP